MKKVFSILQQSNLCIATICSQHDNEVISALHEESVLRITKKHSMHENEAISSRQKCSPVLSAWQKNVLCLRIKWPMHAKSVLRTTTK